MLSMMIWSGMLIYWANPVYALYIGSYELVRFFPAWFNDALGVPYRLAEGLQLHFFFMWLFTINGLAYVIYLALSGEWRALMPVPGSFKRAGRIALSDLRLSKTKPPQGKYNDAQRIAYTAIVLMGIGSVATGLAIYKPTQLAWLTAIFGGYQWARWFHFWLTMGFVVFFFVHLVQVVLAGWANLRGMVTGSDIVKAEVVPDPQMEAVND